MPSPGLLQQVYPTISDWASGFGWVEFGIDERDRPFARALDEGGTVWKGEERYGTLEDALLTMEAKLGQFMGQEGFNRGEAEGRSLSQRGTRSHHFASNHRRRHQDGSVMNGPSTGSSPHRWYFRYQHLYAPLVCTLFSPYTIFVYDFEFLFRDRLANMDLRHDLRRLRVMAIVATEKLAYFSVMLGLPLWSMDQPWWAVILGFAVMHCAASLAFTLPLVSTHVAEGIAFPVPDGSGYVEGCWATHQLATSMDYIPDSRLVNWVLDAANAHAAHHLFPDVCHVHYVALSAIIRETALEYGVPYPAMPFTAAFRSHFRHLRRMGPGRIPRHPWKPRGLRPERPGIRMTSKSIRTTSRWAPSPCKRISS